MAVEKSEFVKTGYLVHLNVLYVYFNANIGVVHIQWLHKRWLLQAQRDYRCEPESTGVHCK